MKDEFICQNCGRCCIATDDILAYPEDVRRWKKEKRYDILKYVEGWEEDKGDYCAYDFTAPSYGKGCAFLGWKKIDGKRIYRCKIYETRPVPCKQFPYDNDGNLEINQALKCKGLEKLKRV